MEFRLLHITCCSATFELVNRDIYQTKESHSVFVDDVLVLKTRRNVFSVFDLSPDREYVIRVEDTAMSIHTLKVSYVLHMKDFVRGSHEKDDTLRVQMAISMLPKDGLLVFDDGDYHVTSLFLKSNITLQLTRNARILGNTDRDCYPLAPGEIAPFDNRDKPLELVSWEGNPLIGKPSLINGYEVENVEIVGEGVFDGQAQFSSFWEDVKHLTFARPRLVFLARCKNVRFVGVRFSNTPCWTIHPFFSSHLGFYDIEISNPKDSPNTDGMDPEACSHVEIIGVRFSVGDDCIALKSGKIYIGKTFKTPCQDVVIRNCFMNEGHGAIVLGSEAGAGLKDLLIERCYFRHTDRGLRIKSRRGRGKDSVIDNVVFKDIFMENVLTPLTINMFYFCDPDGKEDYVQNRNPMEKDERTPYLGRFRFERIRAVDSEYAFGYFLGLPENPIASIEIVDSFFSMKKDAGKGRPVMALNVPEVSKVGFVFENVGRVVFRNVQAVGYEGKEVIENGVVETNFE